MNRKGIILIAAVLVILTILAGCSADDLQKSSENFSEMGKVGMGKAGEKYVQSAKILVGGFVEGFEDCIVWPDDLSVPDETGKEKVPYFLGDPIVKNIEANESTPSFDGDEKLRALTHDVVQEILKASETGSDDSKLRAALDEQYKGKTKEMSFYHTLGDLSSSVDVNFIFFKLDLVDAIASSIGGGMTEEQKSELRGYEIPLPFQTYDLLLFFSKGWSIIMDHSGLLGKIMNKDEGGDSGSSKFDINNLKYIPESISKYVGEREYQTVGDKIAVCLLYDLFDTLKTVLDKAPFVEGSTIERDYDAITLDWFMKNCGKELDRIMSDLQVIGYIYDFNMDVAGLIGSMIK